VPSRFAQCADEIVDGLLFRPEVAKEVARVPRKHDTLLRDQLFDRRMSMVGVFVMSAAGIYAPSLARPPGQMTPAEAVADIRELRKGGTLGGFRIKDLIDEGRKY
jgi:hypothetical protein